MDLIKQLFIVYYMKFIFIPFFFLCINIYAQDDKLNIVIIGAHPDDPDVSAGGTALKFSRLGHNVLFVSLTNGDAGHFNSGGGALAKTRRAEAEKAGKRFGVTYIVLDNHDGELMPELHIRLEVIRLIRQWNADIVIGHRPNDYHPDHRNTAIIVQDAAYMVIVPNIAPDTPPLKKNPVFLYAEDSFKRPYPFQPEIAIDISDVIDEKVYGIAAHKSQFFEWLPWLDGQLNSLPQTEQGRLEWLKKIWLKPVKPEVRLSLIKWYGGEKGNEVTVAEAFEICEYGRRPDDSEIRKLFPMLNK